MNILKQFDINILSLSDGNYHYDFDIDNTFFEALEESLIEKGNLKAEVELVRSERMIIAHLTINGKVELVCDRSLDEFDHPIEIKNTIYFKFAEQYEEISEEVIHIPFNQEKLNLAQIIYELIGITIPFKKLHPKFDLSEDEESEDEGFLVYEDENEENESNNEIDPRWAALKNLKK